MLLASYIKENKEKVLEGLKKRNFKETHWIDTAIEADEQRRSSQFQLDGVLAEINSISKDIGELFKLGKTEEADALKEKSASLKQQTKELQEKLKSFEEELFDALLNIPNVPHDLVPEGNTEADNVEVYRNELAQNLAQKPLAHWDLAEKFDLINFEQGVKITGAGFPVYRGKGAKLQRAMIQYFLDKNTEAGYEEINPPFVVNEDSARGTGQLPDKEGQMYHATEDNLYLIPTSEVPVTNIYRNELLTTNNLPIKMTAYSPCFRREAGSYGKDVRGLNRLHQFEKVEIVRIEKQEDSYAALDQMVEHVKGLLEDLELPFRVIRLCGGDLGFVAAMTYDFEVWSAAQERWLEVSSVSNFETYQANRLKLRYKDDGKTQLCHTLNGSALALPRVLAGLLENHQDEQGIVIPKKLQKYTGFDRID